MCVSPCIYTVVRVSVPLRGVGLLRDVPPPVGPGQAPQRHPRRHQLVRQGQLRPAARHRADAQGDRGIKIALKIKSNQIKSNFMKDKNIF